MNDGKSPRQSNKSWLTRLNQFLTGELYQPDEDELLAILRDARARHLLDNDTLNMIEGVLQVTQMRVRDIMIPRVQMVVVPYDAELEAVLPLVIEFAHSRFPVIEDDRSKVVGILMAKDLLRHIFHHHHKRKVGDIMRPVCVIPESKRLNVLLKEFRTERNHMAIVIDEYGLASGLITIEDVLE
ncbi:MAG: hypothetical protein RL637_263, partial [Pseudomonadota bacterium]